MTVTLVSSVLVLLFSAPAVGDPPPAATPRIDGVLAPEEWKSARREPLLGGGEVALLAAGEWLYVGLRGEGRGIASLCLAGDERIDILHASAALGTATYRPSASGWRLERGFTWEMRDSPASGPATPEQAEAFSRSHGWLGKANRHGSSTWEFKIKRPAGGWRLGVNFLTVEPLAIASWPGSMADDCALVRMAQGDPPPAARFAPERWSKID